MKLAYSKFSALVFIALMLQNNLVLAVEGTVAGKILFSIGTVHVEDILGQRVPGKRGAQLHSTDKIITGKKGHVQIKFIDEAYVSVKPNSIFEIADYVYDERNYSDATSEFNLIKGGFRAVTGQVGVHNRKGYRVKTAVATLGVRGTDYSVVLCETECQDQSETKNGLYVGVIKGRVIVEQSHENTILEQNDYGFLASSDHVIETLNQAPKFLLFDKVDRAEYQDDFGNAPAVKDTSSPARARISTALNSFTHKRRDSKRTQQAEQTEQSKQQVRKQIKDVEIIAAADTTPEIDSDDNNPNEISLVGIAPPNNPGSVTFISGSPDGLNQFPEDTSNDLPAPIVAYNYNAFGQLIGVYAPDSSTTNWSDYAIYQLNEVLATATVVEYDSDSQTGLSWGRWSNGDIDKTIALAESRETQTNSVSTNTHFLTGLVRTENIDYPSVTGKQSFTLSTGPTTLGNTNGLTTATDNLGNTATATATLEADFVNLEVDATVTVTNMAGYDWVAKETGMNITNSSGRFYDDGVDVTVKDNATQTEVTGITTGGIISGALTSSGAIKSDAGVPMVDGAGFIYELNGNPGGTDTSINGAAAFYYTPTTTVDSDSGSTSTSDSGSYSGSYGGGGSMDGMGGHSR